MTKFSIVIPIFNEEKNIENLLEEIFVNLIDYNNNYEIILVNDASVDNSKTIIEKIVLKYPELIKLINNKENQGQSFSLTRGIKNSKYNIIITLDGDGQNNPKDIPKLLSHYLLKENISLVGGIRVKRKDSLIKIVSSKIANYIRNIILKDNCPDTGCSLKVFDKKVFLNFPFFSGIHRFLPALFTGFGKETLFLPVDHRPRLFGNSKYGTFGRLFNGIKDTNRVLKIINNTKKN